MQGEYYTKAKTLVVVAQTQQLPFLAAAIAYYAFLSAIPLLIVALTVATAVAGQTLATQLLSAVDEFLTPEAATLVEQALVGADGRGGITLAGLAVLLWGSLRVFRGLDIAFSRVYGNTQVKSLPEQLRDALLVLAGIALAVASTVVISALLPLSPVPLAALVAPIGLLVILPVVFFPLYYVFPARDVTVREALPGAVIAGVGWTALGTVFGIYATHAGAFQLYGVLGGVLLLLVWFYVGGLLLLFGASVNAVLAGRLEDRQLQQEGLRERRQRATMSEGHGPTDEDDGEPENERRTGGSGPNTGDDPETAAGRGRTTTPGATATDRAGRREETVTQEDIRELQEQLERFEDDIEDRTVHRTELERNLKQYVRRRSRRGHARGWGPYLVLLYGTAMTLGAFYFLDGGWAVFAMIVVWLSTLGLYTLMVIVGLTFTALGLPGRLVDRVRSLR